MMEGPPGEAVEGAGAGAVGAGAVFRTGDAAMSAAGSDSWSGWGAVRTGVPPSVS